MKPMHYTIRVLSGLLALVGVSLALTSSVIAQDSDYPVIELRASSASERVVEVQASGDHEVQESATLRARGCVGYVADSPVLRLVFHDNGTGSSPVIRAESDENIVLLVGSANQGWYCNDDTYGTDPEIRLPSGSRTYSVWVGIRNEPTTADATVRLSVRRGSGSGEPVGGRCGEASARIPQGVTVDEWADYECETSTDAGPRWSLCLPRGAYSDDSEDGCPGAERCCPPPGFSPSVAPDMQPADQSDGPVSGACGEASARRPANVTVDEWSRFQCESPGAAGSRWTRCLPRSAYSDMEDDGCPDIQRCCPPEGFDPSDDEEDTSEETQSTSESEETASTDPSDPPPLTRDSDNSEDIDVPATDSSSAGSDRRPADTGMTDEQSVEAATPDPGEADVPVVVGATPFSFAHSDTMLVWRGFSTTIPARSEPDTNGDIAFDFPVRGGMVIDIKRSWLAVHEPRVLNARSPQTLTDRVSGETFELDAGERIELLAALNSNYCVVEYRGNRHEALCPDRESYRGAGRPFEGLTPERFEWFVLVSAPDGELGWVHVDSASPLFDVVVE